MTFGIVLTLCTFLFFSYIKKKTKLEILNPLLLSIIFIIGFLKVSKIEYQTYKEGADFINIFLTPAPIALAIPLKRELAKLKSHMYAIMQGILIGVLTSALTIMLIKFIFTLEDAHYKSLLPKSITTAIGIGISESIGGIPSITVFAIIMTGIFGSIISKAIFKAFKISHPLARGLSLGCASHAIGTAKAAELGEMEAAASSLGMVISGIITVIVGVFL